MESWGGLEAKMGADLEGMGLRLRREEERPGKETGDMEADGEMRGGRQGGPPPPTPPPRPEPALGS